MESVLAPAPSLQWPPIYVLPHLKQKWLSCSLASVLLDATWAPARCCRELSGQGRAAELLYTGRTLQSDEGLFWGFWNAVHPADEIDKAARALAERVSSGPNFAHMMTKTQLNQEWAMSLETAIESEAQAQAICMQTADFQRAYRAFVTKEKPVFEGD